MSTSPSVPALLREVAASTKATLGYSIMFAIVGLIATASTVWTVGQTSIQRAELNEQLSLPDYRTFALIDAEGRGDLSRRSLVDARALSSVVAAWQLGPTVDVRNHLLPAGTAASAKALGGEWAELPVKLTKGRWPARPDEAVVDAETAAALGLADTFGYVESRGGQGWSIVGAVRREHEKAPSGVLYPMSEEQPRSLHVTVGDIDHLDTASQVLGRLARSGGTGSLRLERSTDVDAVATSVRSSVSRNASAVAIIAAISGVVLVSVVSLLMVLTRSQEFGRRRALGATRGLLGALVVLQGLLVLLVGCSIGAAATTAIMTMVWGADLPWLGVAGLVLTASIVGVIAQVPAAAIAAFRDPVRVLRTA